MLLIFFVIDNILWLSNERFSKILDKFLLIGLSLWFAFSFLRVEKTIRHFLKYGIGGFSTTVWKNSDLIGYLKEHPLQGEIYSNFPGAIYVYTGASARRTPRKYLYNTPGIPADDLLRFKKALKKQNNIYLVWFANEQKVFLYSIKELNSLFNIELITQRIDGAIYLIKY